MVVMPSPVPARDASRVEIIEPVAVVIGRQQRQKRRKEEGDAEDARHDNDHRHWLAAQVARFPGNASDPTSREDKSEVIHDQAKGDILAAQYMLR